MYRDQERYGKDPSEVIQVKQSTINAHLKQAKPGDKIFTCSWSDFFIEDADQWRDWAWGIIRSNPQFIWQILTKRPERIKQCLPEDWGEGWAHVWLGVSIEDGSVKQERLHELYNNAYTPNKLHKLFISAEPLIGYVDFLNDDVNSSFIFKEAIDWVIVGGESGNEVGKYTYRPCRRAWIETIVDDCLNAGIPVWVKQLGTDLQKHLGCKERHGTDINEWPESMRYQQFPE